MNQSPPSPQSTRLAEKCQTKRKLLLRVSHKTSRRKRILSFLSGVLSILSAATLSWVVVTTTPNILLQWIAVALAAAGGLLALTAAMIHADGEIANIHQGAAEFHGLRHLILATLSSGDTGEPDKSHFGQWSTKYVTLSGVYDKYMPQEISQGEV
jgi:hypothetical protein